MNPQPIIAARASAIIYAIANGQRLAHSADEPVTWLLPANICPVVPLSLMAAGVGFEFIDIDPETLCLDVGAVSTRAANPILPVVSTVLYVRTYGVMQPCDQDLQRLRTALPAEKLLIDDRCGCFPDTELRPQDASASVDGVIYSTGYGKPVDLQGGGFAYLSERMPYRPKADEFDTTQLDYVTSLYKAAVEAKTSIQRFASADDMARLDNPAWIESKPLQWSAQEYFGLIESSMGGVKSHKIQLNEVYSQALDGYENFNPNYYDWRYNIRVECRHKLLEEIFSNKLFASAHYFPANILFGGEQCPVAESLGDKVLNLFNDRYFTIDQARSVARIVRRHIESYRD